MLNNVAILQIAILPTATGGARLCFGCALEVGKLSEFKARFKVAVIKCDAK